MSAYTTMEELADQQGWDESSQLDMCLQYINNQGSNDAFRDFLLEQVDLETDCEDECP